jgi:Fe-S-cluster containining protein
VSCNRCGRCCHDFGMFVQDDGDIARLFSYHGFEVEHRPEGLYVKGSNPCKHLRMNPLAECDIYIHRPQICRDYECDTLETVTPEGATRTSEV